MAGKTARIDYDNPRAVCIKLSNTDRVNLRVVLAHLKYNPLMPGPISISSAIRFALAQLADKYAVDFNRSMRNV